MAALDWPADLPQTFEASDYQYDPKGGVLRTDMDTGPAKVRRRFTAIVKNHSGSMVMSKSDFRNIFEPWFDDECEGGSLEFNFADPWDPESATIEVRFVIEQDSTAYSSKQFSPTETRLSFTLEELP